MPLVTGTALIIPLALCGTAAANAVDNLLTATAVALAAVVAVAVVWKQTLGHAAQRSIVVDRHWPMGRSAA